MSQVVVRLSETHNELLQKVHRRSRKPVEEQVDFPCVCVNGECEFFELVGRHERVFAQIGQDAGGVEVVPEVGVVLPEDFLVGGLGEFGGEGGRGRGRGGDEGT